MEILFNKLVEMETAIGAGSLRAQRLAVELGTNDCIQSQSRGVS
jgi:hypothetical protein